MWSDSRYVVTWKASRRVSDKRLAVFLTRSDITSYKASLL